eukprot:1362801-Amorphochlora_amoeboformis.AAC.1
MKWLFKCVSHTLTLLSSGVCVSVTIENDISTVVDRLLSCFCTCSSVRILNRSRLITIASLGINSALVASLDPTLECRLEVQHKYPHAANSAQELRLRRRWMCRSLASRSWFHPSPTSSPACHSDVYLTPT